MGKSESDYNLFDWWKKVVIKNYANFEGRARRSEYWHFVLVNILLVIPFYIVLFSFERDVPDFQNVFSGLYAIFFLGMFIPWLAVAVRRLHDLDKSGWYLLIYFIPFGGIVLLVWYFTEGNKFPNKYGDNPKNPGLPEFDFDKPDSQNI